jgi:hypothetical protein
LRFKCAAPGQIRLDQIRLDQIRSDQSKAKQSKAIDQTNNAQSKATKHKLTTIMASATAAATVAACRMDETNANATIPTAAAAGTANTANTKQHSQDSRFSCNICLEAVLEPVVTQCGHLYCWPCLYQWLEPGMLPAERQALTGSMVFAGQNVDESRRVCPVCKAACSVPMIVPIYVRTANEESNVCNNNSDDTEQDDGVDQVQEQGERETQDRIVEITAGLDNNSSPASFRAANDPTAATGLRQRLRFRSRDSEIPYDMEIPARPRTASTASSSNTNNNSTTNNNTNNNTNTNTAMYNTPLSPTRNNRASLSHGLAFSLQQALRPAPTDPSQIPPLHRQEYSSGHAIVSGAGSGRSYTEADPDATEFLSRILLILGSFVILCLLLF